MKLKLIFGIIPVLIIQTNLMPRRFDALSLGLIILIRPKSSDDKGLLEHELVHSRQAIKGLFILHLLRYWLDKDYRYKSELEGYIEQAKHSPSHELDNYARALANSYGLDVTESQAHRDIFNALQ